MRCKITADRRGAQPGVAAQRLRAARGPTHPLRPSSTWSRTREARAPRIFGAPLAHDVAVQIRGDCCRLAHAPPGDEVFELVREVISPVPAGGRARGHGALRRVDVECHRGELKDGEVCAACEHLLNAVPSADGKSLRVRCMFLESDDISTQMTLARDLATIEDTATLATAAVQLQQRHVKQLLVTSEGSVVGVIAVRDLHAGRERDRVATRTRPLTIVPRTLTIGAAARAMLAHGHACLGVVDGSELLGLVTRGDLRRAGVPGL